jgi:hypothetical protein
MTSKNDFKGLVSLSSFVHDPLDLSAYFAMGIDKSLTET